MKKTRIAFLASTLTVAGAENVLWNLITGLPPERFECEVYCLREAGPIGAALFRRGIRGAERLQDRRVDPRVAGRLSRRLRAFSPHVLFSLDHHNALFWGGVCSILAGVPRRVVASHATGRMNGRPSFVATDWLFLSSIDVVVALSESHARYLIEREAIDPARIVIIENGIDIDRYARPDAEAAVRLRGELGLGPETRVATMVAALRPEKAHEALLEAARRLHDSHPELVFLVVGDGPRRGELEALSVTMGLEGRVRFLGRRRDVADLLHVSNVVVLPSHAAVETLPLSVLEAMAAGVPVVASRVGSVPDIIQDRVNGFLIAPADPIGLGDAICYIIDKGQEMAAIVENAKITVQRKYTASRMVSQFAALFERLAA